MSHRFGGSSYYMYVPDLNKVIYIGTGNDKSTKVMIEPDYIKEAVEVYNGRLSTYTYPSGTSVSVSEFKVTRLPSQEVNDFISRVEEAERIHQDALNLMYRYPEGTSYVKIRYKLIDDDTSKHIDHLVTQIYVLPNDYNDELLTKIKKINKYTFGNTHLELIDYKITNDVPPGVKYEKFSELLRNQDRHVSLSEAFC
jgi:hypothetical protein